MTPNQKKFLPHVVKLFFPQCTITYLQNKMCQGKKLEAGFFKAPPPGSYRVRENILL